MGATTESTDPYAATSIQTDGETDCVACGHTENAHNQPGGGGACAACSCPDFIVAEVVGGPICTRCWHAIPEEEVSTFVRDGGDVRLLEMCSACAMIELRMPSVETLLTLACEAAVFVATAPARRVLGPALAKDGSAEQAVAIRALADQTQRAAEAWAAKLDEQLLARCGLSREQLIPKAPPLTEANIEGQEARS